MPRFKNRRGRQTVNSENLKERIGIHLVVTMKIKLQKEQILEKCDYFLASYASIMNPY